MVKCTEKIYNAACRGRFDEVRRLVHSPDDLNVICDDGTPLLRKVITDVLYEAKPYCHGMVKLFLDLGADPNLAGNDEAEAALYPPMFEMDTRLLEILLDAGADPNELNGFVDSESYYDWAEYDYLVNVYQYEMPEDSFPREETPEDEESADTWLEYLDRMALKYGKRRPDHLRLLRERGALRRSEQTERG